MAPENISSFIGNRTITAAFELADALNELQFVATDTNITARVLNHWEAEGLIPNNRKEGERWRKFSFVDFVWIRMVEQMRTIGISHDNIRKIYEFAVTPNPMMDVWTIMAGMGDFTNHLLGNASEEENQGYVEFFNKLILTDDKDLPEFSLLQLLIGNAVVKRCPIRFVVFLDGEYIWIEEHPEFFIPPEYEERFSYDPYVSFSITGILKEFMGSELGLEKLESLQLLGPNEIFLLKAVMSGEYDSIKINFKNRELDTMEMVKSQEANKKILDVLAEADYQNISIVQHKGRVTRIENTIKHRFERNEEEKP